MAYFTALKQYSMFISRDIFFLIWSQLVYIIYSIIFIVAKNAIIS